MFTNTSAALGRTDRMSPSLDEVEHDAVVNTAMSVSVRAVADRMIRLTGIDQQLVVGVGALTGATLAGAGLSPTGTAVTDWLILVVVAIGAVWAASSAPWWALSAVAAIAAVIAQPVLPLLIGVAVFGLSLAIGVLRRSQPVEQAIVAGASMLTLSMSRELRWFGVSTLVAVIAVTVLCVLGVLRRSRRERKLAFITAGTLGAITVIGLVGLLIAAVSARPDLSEGNRVARQGLQQLKQGDFELAQASFERASSAFERADGDLGSLLTQPARLVPLAAQHRDAGAGLSSAAAETTRTIEQQLRRIDFERLRISNGRIDIDAVRELADPMQRLQVALEKLEVGAAAAQNPWLVGRVGDELAELRLEIDEQQALGAKAIDALAVAPSMLGADGERVYFLMFTTPAEARGQGGFMGNYAEVTIDDGQIELTEFGRHTRLSAAGERPRRLENAPADWLDRYALAGFRYGEDEHVGDDPWANITISPDFPATAQVVSELYPKSGGRAVDGVFSLDVFALQELIGLVGPIEADGASRPLTGDNAAEYLLVDQYEITEEVDNAQRIDQLELIAEETLNRLLSTNPPDPIELGRVMTPMVQQRRVYGWLAEPAEEAVIVAAGMDGTLLGGLDGRDGYAVTAVNDGASKMDTFLGRDMVFTPGDETDRLAVTISHDAPVETLPAYAVGNTTDVPLGWAREWVTVYTNRLVDGAFLDGEPVNIGLEPEAGSFAYSVFIDIEPGTSREFALEFEGGTAQSPRELMVQPQPLVVPEVWQIGAGDPAVVSRTTTFVAG